MNEYIVRCPCYENEIKITFDSSGTPTAFLLPKNHISQDELFEKHGIELGVIESEVNV